MAVVFEKVERPIQTRTTKDNPYKDLVEALKEDRELTVALKYACDTADDAKFVDSQTTLIHAAGRSADVTIRKVRTKVARTELAKDAVDFEGKPLTAKKVEIVTVFAKDKITRARQPEVVTA